jgi:hypothetical protein
MRTTIKYKIMKIPALVTAAAMAVGIAQAAPLKSAVLTKKINDVRISESSKEARTAKEGDRLTGRSTVLTGRQSRAELTFPDKTITRIGANSAFRFSSGSRDMEITQGSFLLQVPKNAGGATIRTATVTAAITGTTTMMEYNPGAWMKFICLEGTANLSNAKGDRIAIPPGSMVVMPTDAARFPRPVVINIKKLVLTSGLMDEKSFNALDDSARAQITQTALDQVGAKREGRLIPGYIMEPGQLPGGDGSPTGNGDRTVIDSVVNPTLPPKRPDSPFPDDYTPPTTTTPPAG